MDDSQDYKLISGTEKDGKTTMKFSRKIDTCDNDDYKFEVCYCSLVVVKAIFIFVTSLIFVFVFVRVFIR